MKSEVYKSQVNTRDEMLAAILYVAVHLKKHENRLTRTKRRLLTRVAKCVEVDSGNFRTFIVNCNRFVFSV